MTNKTLPTDLAQSLIEGLTFSACTKCSESVWAKAQPNKQTKRFGFLTVCCKTCANKASLAYYKERYANDEAFREAQKAASSACKKERYANDPEFREALKAASLAWARENPGKANAFTAKYRAKKLQATPAWSDLASIQEFYELCPPNHHVDHVVPLQGELVSGLHVISNLQYLTATENLSKSNTFKD